MAANDPFVPGANIGIRSVPNLRDIGGGPPGGGGGGSGRGGYPGPAFW